MRTNSHAWTLQKTLFEIYPDGDCWSLYKCETEWGQFFNVVIITHGIKKLTLQGVVVFVVGA